VAYSPRIIDTQVEEALGVMGAVVIEGPRACGKTSTALQFSRSSVRFDTDENARELAKQSPGSLLEGPTPRLFDEWQLAPNMWNHIRQAVDDRQNKGQFILTGSAMAPPDTSRHPGTGRFIKLTMRPMTLRESGLSDGSVSMGSLLRGEPVDGLLGEISLHDVIELMCRGGWPGFADFSVKQSLLANTAYLADVLDHDFSSIRQTRNATRVGKVVRSLARNVSTEVSMRRIASDVIGEGNESIKPETVSDYLDALRQMMIIENVQAWAGHLRSRAVLRKSEKRYFVDPSLAVAALGATPEKLLADLKTVGFLFENLVARDLLVYAGPLGGTLSHYRDSDQQEIDFIVSAPGGHHLAVEVKLGSASVDEAAKNLLRFRNKLADPEARNTMNLAVVNSGTASYQRPDGVSVVSIAHLGP
jgi:predicted AAA+ superfamily ATPase